MTGGVPRIPAEREWLLRKRCTVCGHTKPWAEFAPSKYNENGDVRYVSSRCHACDSRRNNDPVARREYRKQNGARIRRTEERSRARRQREKWSPTGARQRLPIAPIREFLTAQTRQHNSIQEMAELVGVNDKSLHRLIREHDHVTIALADQVITRLGAHLYDVYPELREETQ